MRICIVNKHIGERTSPTGYHAWHLANRLSRAKFQVILVSESSVDDIHPTSNMEVICLDKSYQGKQKWWRLVSTFRQAYLFITKVKGCHAAINIILSDPPFLNYWASRILKNEKRIYWTMDVYPDAFLSAGLITKENIFFKYYQRTIKRNLPDLFFTLGEQQSNYIRSCYGKLDMLSCPIGIIDLPNKIASSPPHWYHDDKLNIGYVGTLGEAHDAQWLIALVSIMDTRVTRLILKVNGSKASELSNYLSDNTAVEILDYIPDEELPWMDIQMVILKKEWTHVSVPSKGISAILYGCPVLFCGDRESDTWQYIQSCGWQLNEVSELSHWLTSLDKEQLAHKRKHTQAVAENLLMKREEAYQKLIAFINDNTLTSS